ncbi:cytochrome c biogenesis protein ResB [Corynebacterium halotolerans]|uniref:Membrane protein required for cytochrome c biosynthesis n=1 Tax=Corynebacterium halotolerans YIM 70093 = DSM 44683 TaxID=1121362 RepID=M1NVC2_9CORY|nr:cytochrome c biogenesis protein ResB [Corynebacterium halotolerans]AGF71440.1 membrane protein required for cytochrome c biosynthesis [Corynebacterium halotolerans YIM 70093 = DSM 44683]
MRTVWTYLKKAWHWLTSMRTALVLLFLLAIAAIPGALLPQRSLNESNVNDYIANNGTIAEIYDRLQLFDVFQSTWFAAIFVLLTISLVGCILPRSWDHYKAMKTPPTRAPKRLERLPLHASGTVDKPMAEVTDHARRLLKRWKVAEYRPDQDRAGAFSISAERGHIRELANLIFHLALVGMLITIAAGRMVYYEGQVIVVTESGSQNAVDIEQSTEFCNTSTANFDSFRAGPMFDGTGLTTFCFEAHDFSADYLPNGQAEMFTSNISYAVGEDILQPKEEWTDYQLQVNHPLRIAGDRVYLQGHGFAPTFTVTWPNGESRTQTIQFRPDDLTYFLSSGAMRFDPPAGMYPDLYERRQNQIAIQGLFAPTAEWSGENGELLTSRFPAMLDPAVAIDIYRGDAGLDTGRAQSIFSLDSALIHSGQLQKIERVNLEQGESVTLDDGTTVTFEGANEFANYQISRDPFQPWVLAFTIVMLVALVGSVTIKRRRIWVRLIPSPDGTSTHVELGGLARTDRAGWGGEFEDIHRELFGLPDPDDVEEDELMSVGTGRE